MSFVSQRCVRVVNRFNNDPKLSDGDAVVETVFYSPFFNSSWPIVSIGPGLLATALARNLGGVAASIFLLCLTYVFSAVEKENGVVLEGFVPDESTRQALVDAAAKTTSGSASQCIKLISYQNWRSNAPWNG